MSLFGSSVVVQGGGEFGDRAFTGQYPMPVSPEEQRRWEDKEVVEFRKKLLGVIC